jgi:ribosomal protein S19
MNPFVARHLLAKIKKVNMKEEKKIIVTWSQASSILPAMVGHTSERPLFASFPPSTEV